jgi:hypothetical protein
MAKVVIGAGAREQFEKLPKSMNARVNEFLNAL